MARMRDYHKKTYKNPFFRKFKSGSATRGRGFYYGRGPSKHKNFRKIVVLIFFLAAVGGWIYFLFYSPYFEIKKIEISGLEKINPAEIRSIVDSKIASRRFLFFKQKNIFWFDEESVEKNINSRYTFESFKIDKKLPDILTVELKEKIPVLIWGAGDVFFQIDQEGIVIRELTPEEFGIFSAGLEEINLPLVIDESGQDANIKDNIISGNFVQFIVDLYNRFPENIGIRVTSFKLANRETQLVKAVTPEGWEVYFAVSKNSILQIEKLILFLKDKEKEEREKYEYIDLRFEDRVYYK